MNKGISVTILNNEDIPEVSVRPEAKLVMDGITRVRHILSNLPAWLAEQEAKNKERSLKSDFRGCKAARRRGSEYRRRERDRVMLARIWGLVYGTDEQYIKSRDTVRNFNTANYDYVVNVTNRRFNRE